MLNTEHENERIVLVLGLVNPYLERCVKKWLVKVNGAPVSRYCYYLMPRSFAEKSSPTVQYLLDSFSFFRLPKSAGVLVVAQAPGFDH